jgi:hypothetical protein
MNKPNWMSEEQFAALPNSIEVRELRYAIHEKGCGRGVRDLHLS